ncbi:MAG: ATP-binding protein [Salinivirgaceae bacterium]
MSKEEKLQQRIERLELENRRLRKIINSDTPENKIGYLEAIIHSLPDIVFLIDEKGTYLDILTERSSLLYKEASFMLGKTFRQVLPTEVADVAEEAIREILQNNKPTTIEYKLILHNEEKWFEGRISRVRGTDSLMFVFVVVDITERKNMFRTLENRRLHLRKAQEIAKMAYFQWDLSSGRVVFSDEMNILLALSPKVQIDRDLFLKQVDATDRKQILQGIERQINEDPFFVYEYQISNNAGGVRTHLMHCELHERETMAGIVFGVVQDVTDIRALETDHMRKTEERQAMLQAIPDMIFIQDSDGVFLDFYASEINYDRLFAEPADIIGKRGVEILPPDIASQNLNYIRKIVNNNQYINYEYSSLINERTVYFEARMVPAGQNRVLSIVRDITAKKQAEDELMKAKLMAEESDRLKSEFLANMSHEVRTPMNGIIGFAELLLQDDIPYDERIEYFNIIEKNNYQLLQLIDDIVDVSKIEAKLLNLVFIDFNINNLLRQLEQTYQKEIDMADKAVALTIHPITNDADAYIRADKGRLMQVIENLLSNAVKFTEKGQIDISARVEKNNLVFQVKDTGIGIPDMACKRIFERFSRANNLADKIYRGTGLGLAVTKGLVELMGGQISVQSEEGTGSVFTFSIPHKKAGKILKKGKESAWRAFTGRNILIVEDEDTSYHYLASLLKRQNIGYMRAQTGYEAIEKVKTEPVDLVLMDIQLPELNGYDAARYIKKLAPDLPIIAQTAFALSGDEEKARNAGCDDYVAKPISSAQLLEKLKNFLLT